MTTSLGQSFLNDRYPPKSGSNPLSSSKANGASSDLVSHLVNAVNSQIQADNELEKFRIQSAADVEKDRNAQHYTFLGCTVGIFGA